MLSHELKYAADNIRECLIFFNRNCKGTYNRGIRQRAAAIVRDCEALIQWINDQNTEADFSTDYENFISLKKNDLL